MASLDPIDVHAVPDGWHAQLRGVPTGAGLPPALRNAGLAIAILLGIAMAISDPSPMGLGMAAFLPASILVFSAADQFVRSGCIRLEVSKGQLSLMAEQGFPMDERHPLSDVLDARIHEGGGRHGTALEIRTRKGPISIRVGAHDPEEVRQLTERLMADVTAAGGGWTE